MIRPSLRRIAVLAFCAALAGSGAVYGKPLDTAGSSGFAAVSKGVPAVFWDTLRRFLVSLWSKNGPAGDPNGNPSTKNGAGMDPDGKPSSTQNSQPGGDNGSGVDPDGH